MEFETGHTIARRVHDNGLRAIFPGTKDQFAADLLTLTLASPSVNRHQ